MPRLYKPKHELFAHLVAAGVVDINDAYERAGYVRRRGNPYRLSRKPEVAARIQELRSEIDPADLRTTQHVHAKPLEVAAELLRTAGNRDMAARIANDLRRLAQVLDHVASCPPIISRAAHSSET